MNIAVSIAEGVLLTLAYTFRSREEIGAMYHIARPVARSYVRFLARTFPSSALESGQRDSRAHERFRGAIFYLAQLVGLPLALGAALVLAFPALESGIYPIAMPSLVCLLFLVPLRFKICDLVGLVHYLDQVRVEAHKFAIRGT